MAAATSAKQIVGSVLLAILAQPAHEFGHAVALRTSTGVWPRIGALSVQPLVPVATKAAALLVLAAGDFAVLAWWVRRRFGSRVALIALALFAFEPNLIAHGRYVTTDMLFAFTFFLASIAWNCRRSVSAPNKVRA